jgi:UDP-2,3-diacylglucosamine hydrolase
VGVSPTPRGETPILVASQAWQAIDFLSDLHLCAQMPRTFDAWVAHLLNTPADVIFLLGDLFEVWVGDDAAALPFERLCLDAIAATTRLRPVYVMVGNRDFLIGQEALALAGAQPLADPTVLDAWGRRVVLTHGDAWCLEDHEYQQFRAMVRSTAWQADFMSRPLEERIALAGKIRAESEQRKTGASSPADWADVDRALAVQELQAHDSADLVHGHTHRPGSEVLAPGRRRHVLSDWDYEASPPRAEVLRLTRAGFERVAPQCTPAAGA